MYPYTLNDTDKAKVVPFVFAPFSSDFRGFSGALGKWPSRFREAFALAAAATLT
jgi:hypothetical protein